MFTELFKSFETYLEVKAAYIQGHISQAIFESAQIQWYTALEKMDANIVTLLQSIRDEIHKAKGP